MTAINHFIDHTLLKSDATAAHIDQLCQEAMEYRFYSVCVHPIWVRRCKERLNKSKIKLCTVIGFPLGSNLSEIKAEETKLAISQGADEIDMVSCVGALKSREKAWFEEDIRAVVQAAEGHLIKVILETALLSREEKEIACRLAIKAGAQFVKTSTGFSSGGATVEDVALLRQIVGPDIGVKASGSIRDAATARAMLQAGANRLGTSASVSIIQDDQGPSPCCIQKRT